MAKFELFLSFWGDAVLVPTCKNGEIFYFFILELALLRVTSEPHSLPLPNVNNLSFFFFFADLQLTTQNFHRETFLFFLVSISF